MSVSSTVVQPPAPLSGSLCCGGRLLEGFGSGVDTLVLGPSVAAELTGEPQMLRLTQEEGCCVTCWSNTACSPYTVCDTACFLWYTMLHVTQHGPRWFIMLHMTQHPFGDILCCMWHIMLLVAYHAPSGILCSHLYTILNVTQHAACGILSCKWQQTVFSLSFCYVMLFMWYTMLHLKQHASCGMCQ